MLSTRCKGVLSKKREAVVSSADGLERGIQTKKGRRPGCLCPELEGRSPLSERNGRRPKGVGPAARCEQAQRDTTQRVGVQSSRKSCAPKIHWHPEVGTWN